LRDNADPEKPESREKWLVTLKGELPISQDVYLFVNELIKPAIFQRKREKRLDKSKVFSHILREVAPVLQGYFNN